MTESYTMRRLSIETETSNLMEIEWFKVEYQPSTRHIKDPEVKKNTMEMRMSHIVHADMLEQVKTDLKKERITHVIATPLTIDLPKKCPECDKVGSPIITTNSQRTQDVKIDYKQNVIEQREPERWLRYNHTNGRHHRIGKYTIITIPRKDRNRPPRQIPCIQLKKSLENDCLSYRKRIGTYSLK